MDPYQRQIILVRELDAELRRRKEMQEQMEEKQPTKEIAISNDTVKVQEDSLEKELEYQQSSSVELHYDKDQARKEVKKAIKVLKRNATSLVKAIEHQEKRQNTLDEAQTEVQKLQEKPDESAGESGSNSILLVQKERDILQDECQKLKEQVEIQVSQIAKEQSERAEIETELDVLKERCENAQINQQKIQIERDEALSEVDILKDELEKAINVSQKNIEDKENAHREFRKFIENYDRLKIDVFRLENKLNTVMPNKNRYKSELQKAQLLSTKLREEKVKVQDKLSRLQNLEKKMKEKIERMEIDSKDYEKAQVDIGRVQSEREKLEAENKRLQFELEMSHGQETKAQLRYEKIKEEIVRLQVEVKKALEEHTELQNEFTKVVGEYDALKETTTSRSRSVVRNRRPYDREDRIKEGNDKLRAEVFKLRGLLDKTVNDLDRTTEDLAVAQDTLSKFTSEREEEKNLEMDRLKEDLQRTLNSNQQLETKLHEVSMQSDLARDEVSKLYVEQDKQRQEWIRDLNECDKLREKLALATAELKKDNEKLRMDLAQALAHCNASNDKHFEVERLKKVLQKALQAKDATEMEAGRLAQALENSQIHLANALKTNETTKIEFQRIANELARMNETIEKDKLDMYTLEQERDALRAEIQIRSGMDTQRKTMDLRTDETMIKLQHELVQALKERDKLANILEKQGLPGCSIERQIFNYENDIKKLTIDRNQLAQQLEKTQGQLINFQQETNAGQAMLEKQKAEITRLKNEQKRMSQDFDKCTKDILEKRDKEITNLKQKMHLIKKERDAHLQRAEQWRKLVEKETMRADQAEKIAKKIMKRKEQKAEDEAAAAAVEETQRSAAEMEGILQLLQMSQEEHDAKEKQIMELTQALKNAQAQLSNQLQANAQLEEQKQK